MYNTDMPKRAELPSSAQLFRSTMIAIAAAAAILVTVVLPAEYAIDPTGVGRALGLVEMGEIKAQLAHEAEQDRAKAGAVPKTTPKEDKRSALKDIVFGAIFSPAMAQPAPTPKTADFSTKTEETSVSLKPGDYIEAKLGMKKGTKVKFKWTVTAVPSTMTCTANSGTSRRATRREGRPPAKRASSKLRSMAPTVGIGATAEMLR